MRRPSFLQTFLQALAPALLVLSRYHFWLRRWSLLRRRNPFFTDPPLTR